MARNISNRSLRTRFFGWVTHSYNDNFEVSQLRASIKSEKQNLEGRKKAVAKYENYAVLYAKWPKHAKAAKEMAKIEREALPYIKRHILYLEKELLEELEKLV